MTDSITLELWDDADLANFLNYKSVRSVQRMNSRGEGPPYIPRGKGRRYRPEAVKKWLIAQEQQQPRARRGR